MDPQDTSNPDNLRDGEDSRSDPDRRPTEASSNRLARYGLRILQQPQRARACGYGTKDRRRVDPPPVLELYKIKANGVEEICTQEEPYLVCHASLTDADGVEDCSLIRNHYAEPQADELAQTQHSLIGLYVATPRLLKDKQGTTRLMFVFSDLSIRPAGTFRLRFRLADLQPVLSGSDLATKEPSPQYLPSSVGPSAFRDLTTEQARPSPISGKRFSAPVPASTTALSQAAPSSQARSSGSGSQARSSGSGSQERSSGSSSQAPTSHPWPSQSQGFGSASQALTHTSQTQPDGGGPTPPSKVSVIPSTVVALSERITSFKAKAFPGMLETTQLSRALVAGGYSDIHLRRPIVGSGNGSAQGSRAVSPPRRTATSAPAEHPTIPCVPEATAAIAASTITDPMEPIEDTMVERLGEEDEVFNPADDFKTV
ncbi:velvet factor-domain-containing protein [Fimicolochytrium jonesii]|uniref:velvet factor-domain-containing protein n=1 Tax=Fimicolochytrium jonesii TaxID=1396493 RepID=UPI0022FF35CA|nr:velvet factor-domain-containing protein [Fimicolochytrium jonesii]KAI8821151.1 velvet factor-domain-containing protein [Fimicolochytrium jonesii]